MDNICSYSSDHGLTTDSDEDMLLEIVNNASQLESDIAKQASSPTPIVEYTAPSSSSNTNIEPLTPINTYNNNSVTVLNNCTISQNRQSNSPLEEEIRSHSNDNSLTISLRPNDYPRSTLTRNHVDKIMGTILEEAILETNINIERFGNMNGGIIITLSDLPTLDWIKNRLSNNSTIENYNLILGTRSNLLRTYTVEMTVNIHTIRTASIIHEIAKKYPQSFASRWIIKESEEYAQNKNYATLQVSGDSIAFLRNHRMFLILAGGCIKVRFNLRNDE